MAGFHNETMYATNVDFTGNTQPSPQITADGQLLIGSSTAPNIQVGTLTAGTGVSITNGHGSITVAAGATVPTTFTEDSGTATPALNNINILGTSAQGLSTSGSGSTVTLTNADWTTTQKGVGTLAANAEAIAGTVTNKAITPSSLKAKLGAQTAHSLAVFEGTTSALTALGAATNGQIPIGATGGDPVLRTISAGSGIAVTNGAGTISIALSGATPVTAISGDVGSAAGTTISLTGSTTAGSSVAFNGASSALTLTLSDTNHNIFLGANSGTGALANLVSDSIGIGTGTLASGTLTGAANIAIGSSALSAATLNANENIGVGGASLSALTTGINNIALGTATGRFMTTGIGNTLIGDFAGANYTTSESFNICLGSGILGNPGDSNTLTIGAGTGTGTSQLNQTVICGINGIVVTGVPVLVSSTDQLGVASSSLQFKKNVEDMSDDSASIMNLRPVTFQWKEEVFKDKPTEDRQYGLIAEEVAQTVPYLCVYDKEGKPFSVKYNELPAMLLNEMQKMAKRISELEAKLA